MKQQVHIVSDNGQVDQNDVEISKPAGDEVTWFAQSKKAGSTIEFSPPDGSPFQDSTFSVPAGGSVSSGPAKGEAEAKRYKYTVTGPDGDNDPGVIIQN